jgi:hypothetical protein
MKKIVLLSISVLLTSGIRPSLADVESDFSKTFAACQTKIKGVSYFEDFFPKTKPKEPMKFSEKDYLATLDQLKKYAGDKLVIAGRMLADWKQKKTKNAPETELKNVEKKLGEEVQAVATGCKNMGDAIVQQINMARDDKNAKLKKK